MSAERYYVLVGNRVAAVLLPEPPTPCVFGESVEAVEEHLRGCGLHRGRHVLELHSRPGAVGNGPDDDVPRGLEEGVTGFGDRLSLDLDASGVDERPELFQAEPDFIQPAPPSSAPEPSTGGVA